MSDPQPKPLQSEALQSLRKNLAALIFHASVTVILFAGTFPFDFTFKSGSITEFDWRWKQYDPGFADRGENILLFIPFGFGLAAILPSRRRRSLWRIVAAAPPSLVLSALVELAQMFISFRDPSLMDLWTNTIGGVAGSILYLIAGDHLLMIAVRGLLRLRWLAQPPLLGSLALAYGLFHLAAPLLIRDPSDLSVWDQDLPLVVGNETTGDRPWSGTVRDLFIADRAATAEEAQSLARGRDPAELFGSSLLGHYSLLGPAPYPDLIHQLPPLLWAGPAPPLSQDEAVSIDPQHWLKSSFNLATANQRIMRSRQFTFALEAATSDLDQGGPARIASISSASTRRNIALAQEFTYKASWLVVRVRTAMRSMPDLYLRNVFERKIPRQLLVTAQAGQIIVYVDGKEQGRIHITPEAKVIWRLYPRPFRLRLEKYGFRSYAAIYRAIVFIPFAAVLGATLMLISIKPLFKSLAAAASILGLSVLIELILLRLGGTFEPINLIISLAIGSVTLLGLMLWRCMRDDSN